MEMTENISRSRRTNGRNSAPAIQSESKNSNNTPYPLESTLPKCLNIHHNYHSGLHDLDVYRNQNLRQSDIRWPSLKLTYLYWRVEIPSCSLLMFENGNQNPDSNCNQRKVLYWRENISLRDEQTTMP